MNVAWTIGGVMTASDSMDGCDFNGDGIVSTADGQALLDYATGVISTLTNLDKADIDSDGDVDSHDAYVFLKSLSTTTAVSAATTSKSCMTGTAVTTTPSAATPWFPTRSTCPSATP